MTRYTTAAILTTSMMLLMAVPFANGAIVRGGADGDSLLGTAQADRIAGYAGDDLLRGRNGSDRLAGGAGGDTLKGGNGDDRLLGGAGNDVLLGGRGSVSEVSTDVPPTCNGEVIEGVSHCVTFGNLMIAGDGNDLLVSDAAVGDTLFGGSGDDTFRVGHDVDPSNDEYTDFDEVYCGDGDDTVYVLDGDVSVDTACEHIIWADGTETGPTDNPPAGTEGGFALRQSFLA